MVLRFALSFPEDIDDVSSDMTRYYQPLRDGHYKRNLAFCTASHQLMFYHTRIIIVVFCCFYDDQSPQPLGKIPTMPKIGVLA